MKSYLDHYLEITAQTADLPSLRRLERDYLAYLIDLTAHNITEVSRILAISRTSVYQRINRFGLGGAN